MKQYEFLCEREPGEDLSKYSDRGQYPEGWTDRWEERYQDLKRQGAFKAVGKPLGNPPRIVRLTEVEARSSVQRFCRDMDAGRWPRRKVN